MTELRLYVAKHSGMYSTGATVAVAKSRDDAVVLINRELRCEGLGPLTKEEVNSIENYSLQQANALVVAGLEP